MPDIEKVNITVTLKHALWILGSAAATVVATISVLWFFTVGGMQGDLSSIRDSLENLRVSSVESLSDAYATETDLRSELSELTAQLRVTTTEISSLAKSLDGLDRSVQAVDDKLSDAISRQESFERWVVIRLGAADFDPAKSDLPPSWWQQEREVIKVLMSGDDPLVNWHNAVAEKP